MREITAQLIGIKRFRKPTIPKSGQCVIWIWDKAGQVTAGDYYKGKARDAAQYYTALDDDHAPTHWMPWPDNWPDS